MAASLWKYCEGAEPSLWAIAFKGWEGGGRLGVYRYFKGVGAGYTREIESIKEKDEHCERAHGYQEREEVFF